MPHDFKKLATQPREIDYLAYIKDEHWKSLNEWEQGFVSSCIVGLKTKYNWLTQKQRAIVDKLIKKFDLANDEFCVRNYAEQKDIPVDNSGDQASDDETVDDFDDDIPF